MFWLEVIVVRGLLLRAIETGDKLEMIYLSKQEKITYRTIKVISVGKDSFRAFCFLRKEQRVFKLDRILSIGKERWKPKGA